MKWNREKELDLIIGKFSESSVKNNQRAIESLYAEVLDKINSKTDEMVNLFVEGLFELLKREVKWERNLSDSQLKNALEISVKGLVDSVCSRNYFIEHPSFEKVLAEAQKRKQRLEFVEEELRKLRLRYWVK